MKKLLAILLAVVMSVACLSVLAACDGGQAEYALITLHGDNSTYDKNFIDAFKAACKEEGVKGTVVSDIPEGVECYQEAAKFADKGYKAVFADSFGHEDFMMQAAREYPNVQFYHATGTQAHTAGLDNFHNAFASIYEGRYLAGYAAGLKLNTMKDKAVDNNFTVGYIGAFTYAEVMSGYTSWYLGLCAALEDGYTATMKVTFTGTWYDETLEQAAANTLIGKGCVLISQHADSMGAPTACQDANIPNVAYNGSTGKDTLVAYSKIDWTPYFKLMIRAAKGGDAVPTDWTGTLENGAVKWELGPNAAEGTLEKVQAVEAELKAGTRQVFDCATFTVNGQHLTEYMADVDTDAAYTPDTNVVKTQGNMTYIAESFYRSAPYFAKDIDGIIRL